MIVICSIALAFSCGLDKVKCIGNADVKGVVKGSIELTYLVDFSKSKQAKDPDIATDLSLPLLVEKNKCVELK